MSTTTLDRPTPTRPEALDTSGPSFALVVHSEWIKLTTLRSTPWTIALSIVFAAGIAAMMGWASTMEGGEMDLGPESFATVGYFFAQLPLAVLGALIVTGEY